MMKKKVIACSVVFFVLISVFLFNFNEIKRTSYISDDYQLAWSGGNGFSQNGDEFVITGEDAYLVYYLGEEVELYNGTVYLESVAEKNISFQVYYTDGQSDFSEENSYYTSVEEGESRFVLDLPNSQTRYVRIDIAESVNHSVPAISGVTVAAKSVVNAFKMFFSIYNLLRIVLAFAVLGVLGVIYKYRRPLYSIMERHPYVSAFGMVFLCTTVLYWKYIVGEVYYIFYDIATDSLYQTYPGLLYEARRIQAGEWGSGFSFFRGLGSAIGSMRITLRNWFTMFGEENVAYLMGISQWIKVALSGCFAYAFSRCYGNKHKESCIIALGYAFNACIISRGAWANYPNEVLLIIIWLTAYEYYHQRKKAVFLPVATVLLFGSQGTYHCVLWGVLLAVYIAFRVISEREISKNEMIYLCKTELLYVLFAAIAMWDTMNRGLVSTLSSERFQSGASKVEELSFFTISDMATGFARTIGTAINGVSWDYVGANNLLEGPAFYCGILIFLMIPFSIYNMPKIKRIAYLLGYSVVLMYICVLPIRYIANGFAVKTYKLSTLWIVVLMVLTAMDGLRTLASKKQEIAPKSRAVFNMTVLGTVIGLVGLVGADLVTRQENWLYSLGFVLIYAIIVNLLMSGKLSREMSLGIICICVMIETCVVSWDVVNDRVVVTKEQMEEGVFYNGSSNEAIKYLKETDEEWYRIDKKSDLVFLCDALAQDYYGTISYVGGTGITPGVVRFYRDLGLPYEQVYMYGSGGNIGIDSLLGVKYFLTNNNTPMDLYGTTYLRTVGDIDIYQNKLALPVAYLYEDTISYEEFMEYSEAERRNIILEACVLDDVERTGWNYQDTREVIKAEVEESDGIYYLDPPEESVLIVKVFGNTEAFSTLYCQNKRGEISHRYFNLLDNEEAVIEIYMDDISTVWFSTAELIENVEFYYQNADEYYQPVLESIEILKENSVNMESFEETYISETVSCENAAVLATSIPYDSGWKLYVDGELTEIMRVNVGFVGAELAQGEHTIELYYESRSWLENNIGKIMAYAVAVIVTMGIAINQKRRKTAHKDML